MVRLIDRRSFLAAGATAGVVTIAGCGQDSGSTETENGDEETDGPDTPGGTDDSIDGEEMTTEESSGGDDGASFDLDLTVDQLPDAFESLTIEFTGLSFFTMTGSTITRDSDPVQVDLTDLAASGASTDLMETSVPADEYDSSTYFIAVTDTTMSSDDSEQTFRSEEDGEVIAGFKKATEGLEVGSGESITLTAQVSVQDAFDYDWKFNIGFSIDRES